MRAGGIPWWRFPRKVPWLSREPRPNGSRGVPLAKKPRFTRAKPPLSNVVGRWRLPHPMVVRDSESPAQRVGLRLRWIGSGY